MQSLFDTIAKGAKQHFNACKSGVYCFEFLTGRHFRYRDSLLRMTIVEQWTTQGEQVEIRYIYDLEMSYVGRSSRGSDHTRKKYGDISSDNVRDFLTSGLKALMAPRYCSLTDNFEADPENILAQYDAEIKSLPEEWTKQDRVDECCVCLEPAITVVSRCKHRLCRQCHFSIEPKICPLCRRGAKVLSRVKP